MFVLKDGSAWLPENDSPWVWIRLPIYTSYITPTIMFYIVRYLGSIRSFSGVGLMRDIEAEPQRPGPLLYPPPFEDFTQGDPHQARHSYTGHQILYPNFFFGA